MLSKYRIVEKQNLNGNIVFVPQERKLLFFWMSFVEMTMFPKRIEFETVESARKFIRRQSQKPQERYYYD